MLQCTGERRKRATVPVVPDNTTAVRNFRIKVVETVQKRKSPGKYIFKPFEVGKDFVFNLTIHSTHFSYGYMMWDIC